MIHDIFGFSLAKSILRESELYLPLPLNSNNSYDILDYARILQRRVGSLSVLAPRRQTQ